MQTKLSKVPKVGQRRPKSKAMKDQEDLFAPVLVQEAQNSVDNESVALLLKNKKGYRRSVYTLSLKQQVTTLEDISSTSSITYSSSSDEEGEEEVVVNHVKMAPHRISPQQRNVKRIPRTLWQKTNLHMRAILSLLLSLPMLATFLSIAVWRTGKAYILDAYYYKKKRPQDCFEVPIHDELLVPDETYYADRWGYTSEMHEVLTQDGYILKMYRIFKKGTNPQGKRPVLIGHGLFQCSGAFVLNEERSLAFTLINQGYDVWVGNNRSIAGLDHVSLSHEDPEYWNWGLKELGIYDFAAMVDHVLLYSGFSKVAYIGHSQGNAQAFIALSLLPELADKLSCFVALAPAVFSGTLVNTFPLTLLINLNDWLYNLMFGTAAFLPIMSLAQILIAPKLFCFLAYSMFSYLFQWWDSHWLRRRKAKYFQFTPRPVSAKLISDWITGWGRKGVCMYIADQNNSHQRKLRDHKVPLVVFYGTADYLVSGERFVRTFAGYETHGQPPSTTQSAVTENHGDDQWANKSLFPMLELVHVERVEGYEHMDTIWGHDNHETTYPIVLNNLENGRWD